MFIRVSAATAAVLLAGTALAHASPTVAAGYTLTTIVQGAPAGSSKADSITAVPGGNVYVGYGNGHANDGTDGLSSTIVEYSQSGAVLGSTSVLGHNDGLRYDSGSRQLWSLQNQDGNPNLVLINPTTLAQSQAYTIPATHGGGYDDVAFSGGTAYLTASSPALDASGNSLGYAALVSASIPATGNTLAVKTILTGTSTAIDVATGKPTTLNLTDPDGIVTKPDGSIQFTSQGDSQIITVHNPGAANQTTDVLNLPAQVDDIAYASPGDMALLFTDATTSTVYELTGPFVPGAQFVASSLPDGTANPGNQLGLLDPTGKITTIVSGVNPGGLEFVPEPGAVALLGVGLLALAGVVRRRV